MELKINVSEHYYSMSSSLSDRSSVADSITGFFRDQYSEYSIDVILLSDIIFLEEHYKCCSIVF